MNMATSGAPKIRKNASKKNKKSWRKNIDMTDVDNFLEEQRLEERTGGILAEKKDQDIFTLDSKGKEVTEDTISAKKKKKQVKPLKCFALLEGLPGAPDPKTHRNRTRTTEERMNPVVKRKLKTLIEAGVVSKKMKSALANRAEYLKQREETQAERRTRRRTKFDFDLWDEDSPNAAQNEKKTGEDQADDSWISDEARTHTKIWTTKHVPKASKSRNFDTGTLLPPVEVPHPGQSYNPALSDHQDVLWKATMVELAKEKERLKVERQTTEMFPTKDKAPTEKSILLEMSEGIPELGGKVDNDEEEEKSTPQNEVENSTEVTAEDGDSEDKSSTGVKPKTRKQRRDMKIRAYQERQLKLAKKKKLKEDEVFRLKSMKKELHAQTEQTKRRQARKEERRVEKMKNPIALSKYKYEAPEIEIKLSEELTGNLRNLKPEGSLLEDRYKSMQRRNIVETRVVHKAAKANTKKVEKRSHKMGWEAEQSAIRNRKKQKFKSRMQKRQQKK